MNITASQLLAKASTERGAAMPIADIVLKNGPIWCGRNEGITEAVAIWQGRILATGRESDIQAFVGPSTRIVDLDGRLATPGLNDSHLHLISLGLMMDWVDAKPSSAPTLDALTAAIAERAAALVGRSLATTLRETA